VIQRAGHGGRLEGATSAGGTSPPSSTWRWPPALALPLLQLPGLHPGARDATALQALTIAYCLLPCLLKLAAAALLWRGWIHPPTGNPHETTPCWPCCRQPLAGRLRQPHAADYAAEKAVLDLKTYFNGPMVAHGIFTDRSGKVVRRFTVQMTGTWQGNQGTLDERFTYSDGKTERRVWR
jgi:hypothetical protein